MEKLSMCRICLVENVRMFAVASKNLQEMYETLTDIPLVTEDCRPIHACYFCYAKLKQCCRFKRKCLEAEELFAEMLRSCEQKPIIRRGTSDCAGGLVKTSIENISIVDDGQAMSGRVEVEVPVAPSVSVEPAVEREYEFIEVKVEHESDDTDLDDVPAQQSNSDSEDDMPLLKIKTEVDVEQEASRQPGTLTKRGASDRNMYRNESESETKITATKKQKKTKNWIFLKRFSNEEEAVNFVNSECTWSRNYTRDTERGQKRFYRCNKVKRRGPQCDAELYFLFVNDDEKVLVFQTDSEHNHDAIGRRNNYGIHDKTKQEINKLFDLNLKPRKILSELAKIEGIHLPSKTQLYNYLSDRRQHKFGKSGAPEAKKPKLDKRRTKLEDTITAEQMKIKQQGSKTLQTTPRLTVKPLIKLKSKIESEEAFTDTKLTVNDRIEITIADTSSNSSDKDGLKCKLANVKSNDSDDIKKQDPLSVKEKPFKCDMCSRSYTLKSHLTCHIRSHTGERPYECHICHRCFINTSHLKCHVLTHTGIAKPFKCDICQRQFSLKNNLRTHILVHTGEKPYTCHICKRGFKQKIHLRSHIPIHTGDKPFKCDACHRDFSLKHALKRHIEIMHTPDTGKPKYKRKTRSKK